jgi:hypothetical protein
MLKHWYTYRDENGELRYALRSYSTLFATRPLPKPSGDIRKVERHQGYAAGNPQFTDLFNNSFLDGKAHVFGLASDE